jgi:hypothetical protein
MKIGNKRRIDAYRTAPSRSIAALHAAALINRDKPITNRAKNTTRSQQTDVPAIGVVERIGQHAQRSGDIAAQTQEKRNDDRSGAQIRTRRRSDDPWLLSQPVCGAKRVFDIGVRRFVVQILQ